MRFSALVAAILAAFITGCPVTGCSCEPVPPQLYVYGRVTTAQGDAAVDAVVMVKVSSPGCQSQTYWLLDTTTGDTGAYRTESFDGTYGDLCIVVDAIGAGSTEPPARVTREYAAVGVSDDSVSVDVQLR